MQLKQKSYKIIIINKTENIFEKLKLNFIVNNRMFNFFFIHIKTHLKQNPT